MAFATILVALPFVVVMRGLCVALVKELRTDPAAGPPRFHSAHGLREAVRVAVGDAAPPSGGAPAPVAANGETPPSG